MPKSHWFLCINSQYLQPYWPLQQHPNTQSHKDTYTQTTDIWVIFSKWLNKKGSYSRCLLLPIPYPFRRLLLRLTTPPRIRLLAHNLLAYDKFNKYSIFLSPPPPREITINSLTLNLKTWCYRYKEQSNFVWPILNNLENDQVFIITSIAWTSKES